MAALWRNDGSGWHALASAGFPDEAALHGLVEDAPQLLPLSGSPRLVVVGRVGAGVGSNLVAILSGLRGGRLGNTVEDATVSTPTARMPSKQWGWRRRWCRGGEARREGFRAFAASLDPSSSLASVRPLWGVPRGPHS